MADILTEMKLDYKKELERAAKGMILVHRPETLIKLIARIIVHKVKVTHAGILLYNRKKDTYIFTVSKGQIGLKIPSGLVRLDKNNPLISYFTERWDKQIAGERFLVYSKLDPIISNNKFTSLKDQFIQIKNEMTNLEADTCIPSYFRDELIGILVLGRKIPNEEFTLEENNFFQALSSDVAMGIRNAQLFEELEARLEKEHQLFIQTVMALAAAIDAKDHYTHGHTNRVVDYSLLIADKMNKKKIANFDSLFFENLRVASLLHDIGKIGIPEAILNKNDKLTEEEFAKIKEHTLMAVRILEPIKDILKVAMTGIKSHHERYDGTGYPEGLKGEQIPVIASIIGVADAFDAMTTDRPYRKALDKGKAIEEVKRCLNTQFHPIAGHCLIELFEEGKI